MTCYDAFAETFSHSRKNLKWPEIDFLLDDILTENIHPLHLLDIGCGNGRFL
jgi:predicted TPR repeat methyltransferase